MRLRSQGSGRLCEGPFTRSRSSGIVDVVNDLRDKAPSLVLGCLCSVLESEGFDHAQQAEASSEGSHGPYCDEEISRATEKEDLKPVLSSL